MALVDLTKITKNNGKCYLAIEDAKVQGMIMGVIPKYEKFDYLDYKCPKRGVITEFIVTSKIRGKGTGKELIKKMEQYFKENMCEYVLVDVFAYNKIGENFYNKNGYHSRMHTKIKKI